MRMRKRALRRRRGRSRAAIALPVLVCVRATVMGLRRCLMTPKKLGLCLVLMVLGLLALLMISVPSTTRHESDRASLSNGVHVSQPPKASLSNNRLNTEAVSERESVVPHCTFDECFNLKRCPLNKPFSVYVYNSFVFPVTRNVNQLSELVTSLITTGSYTLDPDAACVFVAVIWNSGEGVPLDMTSNIESLAHWGHDGENHILIELSTDQSTASLLEGVSTGRAIVARSFISLTRPFRAGFDTLLPPVLTTEVQLKDLPLLLPVSRQNFIYFHGDFASNYRPSSSSISPSDINNLKQSLKGKGKVDIMLECSWSKSKLPLREIREQWRLCGDQSSRLELCSKSMFSLVPSPDGPGPGLGVCTYTRLIESLMCGSIPVVIGVGMLPFNEVIDWSQVAISIPLGRLPDLHYILHSVSSEDIQNLRLQGRNLWYNYFRSPITVIQSALNIVRSRTLHPPPLAPDFAWKTLLSRTTSSSYVQIRSPVHTHNFTTYSSSFWNSVPGPHFSYPNTPFKPGPISGSQFSDLDNVALSDLHSHVVGGKVVTGSAFARHIFGNSPEEQFTVILLTYKRNQVLAGILDKLKNVPFLNKVIVVWNNGEDPPTMMWPNIGVPIEVVRGKGNSLNNRFLPFSEIETEAVLSLDDDASLTPDEIQFGFRVWREARDRMVGYPGRSHSYDVKRQSWVYNNDYDCEVSIVLTSAAFFHKIYLYLYSYWMPQEVRDMVDQYMNCEDIAINFLVSHITRKPPIKVTSIQFFPCPTCPQHLSANNDHYNERHNCLNILTGIYGYMPLLYTQFRGGSVLYEASTSKRCFDRI